MMADDAQLLGYVDGELSPEGRRAVEAQLRASSEAREKVALLRASRLDFEGAFAQQNLPRVPDSLKLKVDEMVRAHRALESNDPALPPSEKALSEPVRSRLRGVPVWLAAACVAGAFACGTFVRLGPLASPFSSPFSSGGAQMAANADVSPWVAAAVGYQKLYTRDTVAYTQEDPAAAANIVKDIRSDDRLALRIPDLTSAGLTFKSVQRLRFNNKPLVQIVYLPQNGPPIALCVMKDPKPDQPVATKTVDAMNVATWRQAELSYALIGKPGDVDFAALGKRISNLDMAPLFSDASPIDRPTSG
ncbi:MAG: putative transrane anti-sigma factor [Caballeronia sp.]|jgi:anti-sigma factor RsiW|uniref:anti-sigma factor family protein n=1 Tax=Caballeronia sp. TaxID=1931223 RepID=UPI002625FE33|nr:anti-sigma factor [Caballeronia sp.]MDB5830994.1 putative transrane anti-sigma factor [Caballeronia sp.]